MQQTHFLHTFSSSEINFSNGFTLIELIVVIAIVAVLASVLILAINPMEKINSATDAVIISSVRQFGQAMDSYAVNHGGHYVGVANFNNAITTLYNSGDLKNSSYSPPGGYSSIAYGYGVKPDNCTTDGPVYCSHYYFSGGLKSQRTSSTKGDLFIWTDGQGCFWNSFNSIFQAGYVNPCSL